MPDAADTIAVFTARSPERVIREGGSQSWVLNAARAKSCVWLVCMQNRHNPDHEFSDATEPHGAAFLVGRISNIRRSQEAGCADRWHIGISEYARINVPDAWDQGRNPVRYTSLNELGIDPATLTFQPVPHEHVEGTNAPTTSATPDIDATPKPMTIADAKKALAITFGVKPEAVEITIRG